MVWCLASCALCCIGLAITALTFKPCPIRLSRLSLRHQLRGCLVCSSTHSSRAHISLRGNPKLSKPKMISRSTLLLKSWDSGF